MSRQDDFKQKAMEYNNNVNMHLDFYNGAEYGYQYAQTHFNWISVEEELPKFDEQVLVYGLCPNGCRLFYVDCLIQDINDNGYPKWDDDTIIPTHWMPIVPPRKEE